MVETGKCKMDYTPREAPVYGGCILEINICHENNFPPINEDDEMFLALEGSTQQHLVTMHYKGSETWQAPIPGHAYAETVTLLVLRRVSFRGYEQLSTGEFHYIYDSAYFLAEFLVNCVNNPHALDNLELIKSDQFDLANEVLSTLDERLRAALEHVTYPKGWDLLGNDQSPRCQETLLHMVGRLGLLQTAMFLLTKPGSQEALHVINHEGQQPCGVAADSGFYDIAELFAGYNTNGMKLENRVKDLSTEYGLIHSYGNNGTSLTVSRESEHVRTVEESLEMLREMQAVIQRDGGGFCRTYQTEWPPSSGQEAQQEQRFQSDQNDFLEPGSGDHHDVEEALVRIMQRQKHHMTQMACACYVPLDQSSYNAYSSSVGSSGSQGSLERYPMYEESLTSVHIMNEELLWQRGQIVSKHQRKVMEAQKSRKLHLARFSISCPALDVHHQLCHLSPIQEWDQHRSMVDLGEDERKRHIEGAMVTHDEHHHDQDWAGDVADGFVRICVNGVAVDSSSDLPGLLDNSGSVMTRTATGSAAQLVIRDDEASRRCSWCPESVLASSTGNSSDRPVSPGRSLGVAGKSLSLSGLDQQHGFGKEEAVDAVQVSVSQSIPLVPKGQHQSDSEIRALEQRLFQTSRSADPRDADGCLSQLAVGENDVNEEKSLQQHLLGTAGDTTVTYTTSLDDSRLSYKEKRHSVTDTQGVRSYEEGQGFLDVLYSPITKSLSTPSIPLATTLSDTDKPILRDGRREGKLPAAASHLVEKNVEDNDAQFHRQEEIEEEDFLARDNEEISLKEFLNEEQDITETDEKSRQSSLLKEEKKRKSGVLSRFSNNYRTKKNKEKDIKVKHLHQFVAVSFSNAAVCDICHKPMTNKPALCCENCLINVHEHSCKDQAASCDKYIAAKVLSNGLKPAVRIRQCETDPFEVVKKDGSAPTVVAVQRLLHQGSELRHTSSFKVKDNRSASASNKGQGLISGLQAVHRHSLPTSSVCDGSPSQTNVYFQCYHATSRFSVVDKAISEESETDGGQPVQDTASTSNITETTSESLESLDIVGTEVSFLEEEADLMLAVEEPEAWSITVDRKRLKKMNAKDMKRQDTIWELIQTEKQYVKRLKIMQRLFRDSLMAEQNFPLEQIHRLFPRLDHLLELHTTFLRRLLALQTINPDRSIDDIGPTLLEQFSKTTAEKMKSVYGEFCSKHTEAIQLYKEIAKNDRKFQNFCRRMSNQAVCEKRELPDFILGVTVRLSKYPILIEAILKGTKDKKDRELLSQALQCSKDVVHGVDEKVAAYEKLMEIYKALDSRTTVYRGKKFKRQDLLNEGRQLVHAGSIGWKSARGRVLEVYAVVLSDLILFLQKNEQKFTFFLQDNKSCVVPLNKLLLREKRDARDSHGIYLISQDHKQPEMYELVCSNREQRDHWMTLLRKAVSECPKEEVTQQVEQITEEDRRKHEQRSQKVQEIIDQLHKKDYVIKECCDEKNRLMRQLMEMSVAQDDNFMCDPDQMQVPEDSYNSQSVEMVQAAIQEVSRLTTILQGSGIHLIRSASSVGEHVSTSYVNMPVPKRAETFAGFDAAHDCGMNKNRFTQHIGEDQDRFTSVHSLDGIGRIPEGLELPLSGTRNSVHSSSSPTPQQWGSPQAWDGQAQAEWTSHLPDGTSYHGSTGELSASCVSSLVQPPSSSASSEQMMSVVQLVRYLHNLMNLTVKQCTTVESLRVELKEAKEEIRKLSTDMHGRKVGYGHHQLEELRNVQEKFTRERQEWEATRAREVRALQKEKEMLEAQRCFLQSKEVELSKRKEELRRQQESLRRHIELLKKQGLLEAWISDDQLVHTVDLGTDQWTDHVKSDPTTSHHSIGHRRSASADFYSQTFESPGGRDSPTRISSNNSSSSHDVRAIPQAHRMASSHRTFPSATGGGKAVPLHLLSTFNEHKVGGANVQQLPMKLSSSSLTASNRQQHPSPQQPHSHPPHTLYTASTLAAGRSPDRIPSAAQAQGMILRNQKSRSTPSNLALVMKLSESGSRTRSSSSTDPAPGGPRTAPGGPGDHEEGHPVFYF